MQYLTIGQYAALKGVSRQAIDDRIRRGTLPLVRIRVWAKRIPVDDSEVETVK